MLINYKIIDALRSLKPKTVSVKEVDKTHRNVLPNLPIIWCFKRRCSDARIDALTMSATGKLLQPVYSLSVNTQ